MSSDHDRDYDFEILQKSCTTAHLQMPDFDPAPTSYEAPAAPEPAQDSDAE